MWRFLRSHRALLPLAVPIAVAHPDHAPAPHVPVRARRRMLPSLTGSTRVLYFLLCGWLAVNIALCFTLSWRQITFPYQLDYGEGPLLEQAQRIWNGEQLNQIYEFPTDYPYRTANYPPMYTMVLSLSTAWGPPSFVWGRLLSFVCMLITAGSLFYLVRKLTDSTGGAIISLLLCLSLPAMMWWASLLRVDLLALALSTAALALLVYRPQHTPTLIASVLLLVAAIYTRQTYIVSAPFAAFLFLTRYSLRRALTFAVLLGVLTLLPFVLLNIATDNGLWFHLFGVYGSTAELNLQPAFWLNNVWFVGPVMLAVLGLYLWKGQPTRLVLGYTAGSLVAVFGMIKMGSNINYLLELSVALCMIAGILVARVLQQPQRWQTKALLGALIVQASSFCVVGYIFLSNGGAAYAELPDLRYLSGRIEAVQGRVLADDAMGLVVQQGYPILFQPFDFTQMAKRDLWDQSPVVRDIEAGAFPLIIIHRYDKAVIASRWTDEMLQAIDKYYVLDTRLLYKDVYRPR